MSIFEYKVVDGVAHLGAESAMVRWDSRTVVNELSERLTEIQDDPDAKLVQIGAKQGGLTSHPSQTFTNHDTLFNLYRQMDDMRVPITVLLTGTVQDALLDFALAAHFRLGDLSTNFKYETWRTRQLAPVGSTQRLPKIVGAQTALALLLGGALDARQARSAGLLDGLARSNLTKGALAFAKSLVEAGTGPRPSLGRQADPEHVFEFQEQIAQANAQPSSAMRKRLVDMVEASHVLPIEVGLDFETATLEEFKNLKAYRPYDFANVAFENHCQGVASDGLGICIIGATDTAFEILRSCQKRQIKADLYVPNVAQLDRVNTIWTKRFGPLDPHLGRITSKTDALTSNLLIDTHSYGTDKALDQISGLAALMPKDAVLAFTTPQRSVAELAAFAPDVETVAGLRQSRDHALLEWCGEDDDLPKPVLQFTRSLGAALIRNRSPKAGLFETLEAGFHYALELALMQGHHPIEVDKSLKSAGWAFGPLQRIERIGLPAVARQMTEFYSLFPASAQTPNLYSHLAEAAKSAPARTAKFLVRENNRVAVNPAILRHVQPSETKTDPLVLIQTVLGQQMMQMVKDGTFESADTADVAARFVTGYPVARGGVLFDINRAGLPAFQDRQAKLSLENTFFLNQLQPVQKDKSEPQPVL